MTIIQSNFTQNRAQLGGAIYAENETIIVIRNVSFIFNIVAALLPACSDQNEVASGGAIYAIYGCSISIQSSYFERNQAYCGGNIYGGVIAMYQGSLFIMESEFENSHRGRVAYLLECSISLKQSRLNYSQDGVLFALKSRITIEGTSSTIGNSHGSKGGVVLMINSSMLLKYSTFEHNLALSKTGGVIYATEVCSISMEVCTFRSNSAWYGGVNYYDGTNLTLKIDLCYFFYNHAHGEGGVFYFTKAREALANVSLSIKDLRFKGNHVGNKGGVIFSGSLIYLTIYDDKNEFEHNSAPEGAVIYVVSDSMISIIKSSNSYIRYNSANKQGIVFLGGTRAIYLGVKFVDNNGTALIAIEADITFEWKVEFFGNKAHRSSAHFNGGAISSIRSVVKFNAYEECKLTRNEAHTFGGAIASLNSHIHIFSDTHISNNRAVIGGGLYLYQSELFCKKKFKINENFANSSGGGIYLSMSFIRLSYKGSLVNVRNHAQFGGGVFLTRNSKFSIQGVPGLAYHSLRILLLYNTASRGGAIYVDDETNSLPCRSQSLGEYLEDECFIQATLPFGHDDLVKFLLFRENEATHGRSDIYGGLIDRCRPSPLSSDKPLRDFLFSVSNIEKASISVSSRPVHICFCKNNCSYQSGLMHVMKGEDFVLPLVAVDQVNNSINATVYAYTLSGNSGLGVGQHSQYALQNCTNVTYRIYSEYPSEKLILYPEGPCKNANLSSCFINIRFSHCKCPIGFMVSPSSQSECKCICHKLLAPYLQECNHSSMLLIRNTPVWMDYVYTNTSYGIVKGYNILPHCPYDYCVPPSIPVYINLNKENGSDAQCAFNHSGLLCGATLTVATVYIAVLLLWQWLICIPKCKITAWITNVRLISLMDTYHAPYKGKHRYWPGLLLLTSVIQYSVTALNTQADPMINLFAIIVLLTTLNVYKGSVSGVFY